MSGDSTISGAMCHQIHLTADRRYLPCALFSLDRNYL